MQLLIAVINHVEQLDDILAGFVELGITGATIVNTEGMGHVLSHEVPIFAGLRSLTARSRPSNQTVFSVIEDDKVDAAIRTRAARPRNGHRIDMPGNGHRGGRAMLHRAHVGDRRRLFHSHRARQAMAAASMAVAAPRK